MHQRISLREANQHLSRYVELVEKGEEIIITRRGQPIAQLIPIPHERFLTLEQQQAWKRLRSQMRKGYNLGGEKFDREAAHER